MGRVQKTHTNPAGPKKGGRKKPTQILVPRLCRSAISKKEREFEQTGSRNGVAERLDFFRLFFFGREGRGEGRVFLGGGGSGGVGRDGSTQPAKCVCMEQVVSIM